MTLAQGKVAAKISASVSAGGGILYDSVAADERSEVDTKLRFLGDAAEIELLETLASDAPERTIALHIDRLQRSAELLRVPFDGDELYARIDRARNDASEPLLLRIRLGRDGTIVVRSEALQRPTEIDIALAPTRVRSDDPWLRIKSSYRPAFVEAAAYAAASQAFDAVLCNESGELTEGSRCTLFVRRSGRLLTPPLSAGVLPGILRAQLLEAGEAEEAPLAPNDLTDAEEIYLGNSARGLMRVRSIR